MKQLIFAFLFLAGYVLQVSAQEKTDLNRVTKEQLNQLNEVVKPVKETIDKLLAEDQTGTYEQYRKDVDLLRKVKNTEEKAGLTQKILTGYQFFFDKIWEKANVDEKDYQIKIRSIFSPATAELIHFDPYLGFTIITSTNPGSNPPPPAPDPRADICINDVCAKASGEVKGSSYLISGGGGSYGNCFVKATAWGAVASFSEISSALKNNIAIPGAIPLDNRRLAVTVDYDVKLQATAFAVLGASMASASVSEYSSREYMMVFSPIIFANSKQLQKTVHSSYTIEKSQISSGKISAGSTVFNAVISGSWGNAEASNIRWTVCETK
ncbi:hypothetical protein [Terrimonas alba]|uniref:hypothetical protein n=1 Tax=Terrimonas alba TaxID=3349636 RepID=UPI0035F3C786